jgi:hypothetical protein
MILHRVTFRHPDVGGHTRVHHPTKAEAEAHARRLKAKGIEVQSCESVEVPTDSGRDALADWLNKETTWPDDEHSETKP